MVDSLSIILPARNEEYALTQLLPRLKTLLPDAEILVVDDGSTDGTVDTCKLNHVRTISHPYSMGNGAAVKTGARAASGNVLVFMDADGQHDPGDIPRLLETVEQGYDMVMGARSHSSQASLGRNFANRLYNRMAAYMTGFPIQDLTSGFRAVRARKFRQFLYLLPNGFSYPTTITIAFLRSGYAISYIPIHAQVRIGKSKIRPLRDGTRFAIIILKIGALFSPMRLFLPISLALFSTGIGYYAYTFFTLHRLTNMSVLLFVASLLTFLIGIISEQVSSLHYKGTNNH